MTSSKCSTTSTSKFTSHAAVLLKNHYRNSPFRHYDDAVSPLLDDVNMKGYERVKGLIHKTYPQCDIFKILRVNAPVMYGMYLLHKEEIRLANGGNDVKEKMLYHVTSESNAVESLISGLDWRRTRRSKFGSGVSFGNNADYCNYYANKSTNKVGVRVIIVNTVLINDTFLTKNWNNENSLIIPPGTADTTVSPNGLVFVKYYDFESYPLFFVYYRWTPKILNESKFFNIKTNYTLQRLQQEEQMLCERVADLHIAESSSLPRQSRNSSKKRRQEQRRAAAKAEAEAEAAALLKRQRQYDSEQRRQQQRRAAAKAEAEAEAAALLKRQHDSEQRRQRLRRTAAKAEAKAEAEAAALLRRQRQYDSEQRRQRLQRRAAAKAEAEAEAAEAAALLRRRRRNASKQRRQRQRRAAAKAEAEAEAEAAEAAEAAVLLRRRRRKASKQRRQRQRRAAAKAEAEATQ